MKSQEIKTNKQLNRFFKESILFKYEQAEKSYGTDESGLYDFSDHIKGYIIPFVDWLIYHSGINLKSLNKHNKSFIMHVKYMQFGGRLDHEAFPCLLKEYVDCVTDKKPFFKYRSKCLDFDNFLKD